MPNSSRTSALLAGVTGAVMLIGAGLFEARAQQQPQPGPAVPSEFSLSQIETFADAALEVRRVQEGFDTKVQGAENAGQIEQLQQQARQDAERAVEDKGLSVDEYNAIAQAAKPGSAAVRDDRGGDPAEGPVATVGHRPRAAAQRRRVARERPHIGIGGSEPQPKGAQPMLKASLAAIGLLIALSLGACDDAGDGEMPPQEPVPGAAPPATQ